MNISIFSVCKHCKTSSADPAVAQDIGYGDRGSGVTLTLSGNAAVFLENGSYIIPTILGTQVHYNPVPFVGNTANGIPVPASWTIALGAFLPPMLTPTSTAANNRSANRGQQPHGPVDRAGGHFGSDSFTFPSYAAQASRLKLTTGFNNSMSGTSPMHGFPGQFPVPAQENNDAAQRTCVAYCCARVRKSSKEGHLCPLVLPVGIPCLYRMTIASITGCFWKFCMLYWK